MAVTTSFSQSFHPSNGKNNSDVPEVQMYYRTYRISQRCFLSSMWFGLTESPNRALGMIQIFRDFGAKPEPKSVCVSGTSQCSPRMGLDMTMPIMGHRYGQLVEFSG